MRHCLGWLMIGSCLLSGCQEQKSSQTAATATATAPTPNRTEALAAIKKLGGRVGNQDSLGQAGLKIDLNRTQVQDTDMPQLVRHLQTMPELVELSLVDTAVTDAGLAQLKQLKSLKLLAISDERMGSTTIRDLQEVNPRLMVIGDLKPMGKEAVK